MRTPAGKDCRFYYADYNRGRNLQECRLIKNNPESLPWHPSDCAMCPVPDILNANASPDMELTLTVKPRLLGLGRKLEVTAYCRRHHVKIDDPYVGCPQCHDERPGLDVFRQALDHDDHP
ncbi:MAG TPA: hypothetical protein VHD90_23280 [Phototrophicaceae bacterium]|nr:hypothetical protein [Phototrophicaceae bacterium]